MEIVNKTSEDTELHNETWWIRVNHLGYLNNCDIFPTVDRLEVASQFGQEGAALMRIPK